MRNVCLYLLLSPHTHTNPRMRVHSYVSSMVPVKTMREYDVLQEVMVLFSETVQRAIRRQLITTDMIDFYDPSLMFSIPRLAIIT